MRNIYSKLIKRLNLVLGRVEALSKTDILLYSVVATVFFGIIDYATGPDFSFAIFYLLPIAFATWFSGRNDGFKISLLSVAAAFVANFLWPKSGVHFLVAYWDALTGLVFYSLTAVMLAELKTIMLKEKGMARTDFLTGINNSRNFYELAGIEIKRASRQNDPLTIAYMDLDNLKRVNDTKGHLEGDLLLQTAADIIRSGTRQTDIAARLGGDEFAILMPATGDKDAYAVLERVRNKIFDTFRTRNWEASVSIGAATCIMGRQCSVNTLIKAADYLMYEAKRSGKNRLVQRPIETIPAVIFEESGPLKPQE